MPVLPSGDTARATARVPEIVWPPRILLPPRLPALIYLDLNHYIYLARVVAGEAPDGYDRLQLAAGCARHQGRAIFPLSGTHYVEMSGIRDPGQRNAVAGVMDSREGQRQINVGTIVVPGLELRLDRSRLVSEPRRAVLQAFRSSA